MFKIFSKKKIKENNPIVTAVIPAAGSSSRMGGENKLLMSVCDVPVLVRTIEVFNCCEMIDKVIICCKEDEIAEYFRLCKEYNLYKVTDIIQGGKTRAESVVNGIMQCSEDTEFVAIHDGARPFVTNEIITDTVLEAIEKGAAAPVVPVKDSIKIIRNGVIVKNVNRDEIVAVQTPQVFDKGLIKAALLKAIRDNTPLTDDCSAVEMVGMNVATTKGSYENIKITTPEDIILGEAILLKRGEEF